MAKQKKSKMALYTKQDKIILYCGYALLGLFLLAIIVPMIYIVIASFMDRSRCKTRASPLISASGVWMLTSVSFRTSRSGRLQERSAYSIIFTIISVAVTMLAAYPMSLPDFKGKKIFNTLFVITMFFSGGLIPTYLLINNLGLLDSMWAVILPGAFSVWNMIIARTYYQASRVSCAKLRMWMEPARCFTSSRSCCPSVCRWWQFWPCGSSWQCGTATLTP